VLRADAALVGQLEDALGTRVDRPVQGMSEAGHPIAGVVNSSNDVGNDLLCSFPGRDACARVGEQSSALFGGPQHNRAGAEDARSDGRLQRGRVRRERHPRCDVRGHHPVLGDRDEQQVEEEALGSGRLVPGQEQVERTR
jgi:hypothetical protein